MFVFNPLVFLALSVLALRGNRWAYAAVVVLGLLFFPARVGFHLDPQPCELALDVPLALFSLTNYKHIVMFAWFFTLSRPQFRMSLKSALLWATVATVAMGVAVEAGEGITGRGHCRLRDLIPDAAGALLGMTIVLLWSGFRGVGKDRPLAQKGDDSAGVPT
jgi:hypothetical protein